MPEYRKGPFNLLPNPPYEELALHSEVFQIWPSGEIFTNYEQYADRLYQYNQREWTCKYTGKGQLTFAEAFASEQKERKALESFPESWKGILLAFIQHSTASLDQICSQFMHFVKENYIPGEDIKIDFNGKKMNGKIISCSENANGVVYRVEIFEDEACTAIVGEANVIGSESFSRERQFMNKTMIKRYAKSVAIRRGINYPWFISDDLALKHGLEIELPAGITSDMKPSPVVVKKPSISVHHQHRLQKDQMPIDEHFLNSSAGFLAEERSISPPPPSPQFTFPCDDAIVPIELIDQELKYPDLGPVDHFVKNSELMTRSLSIWAFCQTFASQLKLTPFSYDDWEESLTCTDPKIDSNPIIEETFLALLSILMKDRRNLTKGAFADKLKSAVLTFKPTANSELDQEQKQDMEDSEDNEPEIIISSGSDSSSDDESGSFVKRARKSDSKLSGKKQKQQSQASLLLPSIDLRKHRWYESKAMECWHFVLGSFLLESISLISQFVAEEEAKEPEELETSDADEEDDEASGSNDSAYEDDGVGDDSSNEEGGQVDNNKGGKSDDDAQTAPKLTLKQLNPSSIESSLEVMQTYIKVIEPIAEELTSKGSKQLFTNFLNLSLSSKMIILEFLVHNHHDREMFKAFVEDCLERQGESRRVRNELEQEAKESVSEVERLENEVNRLKEENLKITERLEADESDIEISDDEKEENDDDDSESTRDDAKVIKDAKDDVMDIGAMSVKDIKTKSAPLSESERDELVEKRTVNKKEIASLNVTLRKLRPEAASLQKRSDAAHRDLRKCSSYRTFALGTDRHGREYWWFGDFVNPLGRLLVLDTQKQIWLGSVDSKDAFNQLMEWLNPLGIREAKLKSALLEAEDEIKFFLAERDLPVSLNPVVSGPSTADSEDEIDFEAFRRGRGRPPKGSTPHQNVPVKRPFQKYKNTMM